MGPKWRLKLLPILVIFLLAFCIPEIVHYIGLLGRNIPQHQIAVDYATAVFWAFGLYFFIWLWPIRQRDKRNLYILWTIKCLITLGIMLFYEQRYGLDAYQYFRMSTHDSFDTSRISVGSGTYIVSFFTWFLNRFLPINNSYHALKVVYSMVGLGGIYLIYRSAIAFIGRERPIVLLMLGIFPSILFWSSILGKDPLHLFAISLYFYGVTLLLIKQQSKYFFHILVGVILATMIRNWSAIILLSPFLFFGLRPIKSIIVKSLAFVLILFLMSVGVFVLQEKFGVEMGELVSQLQSLSSKWDHGGSAQNVPKLTDTASLLKFAPLGAFTALFRPLPGEVSNLFGLLAGIENFFLLVLLFAALTRFRSQLLQRQPIGFVACYVAVWSVFYGFVSYQNLGTAVRFKLQVLPFLFLLLLYVYYYPTFEGKPDHQPNSSGKDS